MTFEPVRHTPHDAHVSSDESDRVNESDRVGQPLEEAIIFNRVTQSAWQICDSRCAPHSPGYLLGFVDHVGDGVELMQLGNGFIWTRFPSMQDALAHVITTATMTETDKVAGDLAWVV